MSLLKTDISAPLLKVGIGGNYYVICNNKDSLISICQQINKSPNSIYFSNKYNCWAIRIKSKTHKTKLKQLMPL